VDVFNGKQQQEEIAESGEGTLWMCLWQDCRPVEKFGAFYLYRAAMESGGWQNKE